MNHLLMTATAVALLQFGSGSAQAGVPASYIAHYPEHVIVIDPNKAQLKNLNRQKELIVDHVGNLGYEVYGPRGLGKFLNKQGLKSAPARETAARIADDYPSAEQIVDEMKALQAKYPTLITLTEIGKSVEGRSLVFARVTAPDGVGIPLDNRPEFKYIANMHGDEIVGRDMMLMLIEDLASNYGKDDRITQILKSTQVYILPSMNPDGATHRVRFNAHGVDLNRTFPDFATSDNQNTWENREPEVQAIMKFEAQHHFKLSANFHGGSQVVNYPWDTIADKHPKEDFFKSISLDYAKRVPYLWSSTEFEHGITNGFAWYEVDGGMQDWTCYFYQDMHVTIELTYTKWPSYSTVKSTYDANRDALLSYIEQIYRL